jgi:glycosyltransferase involved in cell wall biosynthesis
VRILASMFHPKGSWPYSGSERRFCALSNEWKEMGLEVFALEPTPIALDYLSASYVPLQVTISERGIGSQLASWLVRAVGKGVEAGKRRNFDLVYATNNNLFNLIVSLWLARRLRLPCVVVVHHLRWVDYRESEGLLTQGGFSPSHFLRSLRAERVGLGSSLVRVVGGYVESKILSRFDGFIVTSRVVASQLIHFAPSSKISVVENAPFKTRSRRASFSGRGMIALSVGRIDEGKGTGELLNAWEGIIANNPSAHLEIAGEGSLRNSMASEASRRGLSPHVHFRGFLDDSDIRKLQDRSRIFITLSRTEGFGMAAAEALAAGLPVVAWDIPPFEEIYGSCKAVFLCRQGNMKEVISTSNMLLTIPETEWNELSAQASNFSQRFSWEEAAKNELQALERAKRVSLSDR